MPIARQAKRTELPSTADLSRSLRINSGSRRRSFDFGGSGLALGAISDGADFSTVEATGAMASSIMAGGFPGFSLETTESF